MSDRLQNSPQSFKTNSNIQQMSGKEEIVEVTHHGEREIPQRVQKGVISYGDTSLPHLIAPVDVQNAED